MKHLAFLSVPVNKHGMSLHLIMTTLISLVLASFHGAIPSPPWFLFILMDFILFEAILNVILLFTFSLGSLLIM